MYGVGFLRAKVKVGYEVIVMTPSADTLVEDIHSYSIVSTDVSLHYAYITITFKTPALSPSPQQIAATKRLFAGTVRVPVAVNASLLASSEASEARAWNLSARLCLSK
jgi:hypothetical protein